MCMGVHKQLWQGGPLQRMACQSCDRFDDGSAGGNQGASVVHACVKWPNLLAARACRLKEGGKPPQPGWPSSGALSYHNVTASYRPGLPPVLRNLTFSLQPGTSCGVVGRTGGFLSPWRLVVPQTVVLL